MIHLTQEQRDRLVAIELPDAELTPALVVEEAASPDSPLHSLFEWDNTKAGHQFRLIQARRVLAVRVTVTTTTALLVVPAYIRNPEKPGNEQGYVRTLTLTTKPEAARETVRQECARAESALTRASAVAAVLGVEDEIEELLTKLGGLKAQMTPKEDESDAQPSV